MLMSNFMDFSKATYGHDDLRVTNYSGTGGARLTSKFETQPAATCQIAMAS